MTAVTRRKRCPHVDGFLHTVFEPQMDTDFSQMMMSGLLFTSHHHPFELNFSSSKI